MTSYQENLQFLHQSAHIPYPVDAPDPSAWFSGDVIDPEMFYAPATTYVTEPALPKKVVHWEDPPPPEVQYATAVPLKDLKTEITHSARGDRMYVVNALVIIVLSLLGGKFFS